MQSEQQEVMSACAEAERHLRAGRLAEARSVARSALAAESPDPRLFLTLGLAHAAEDDDDHDDRAEAAYREGLDAFPDDLDLLCAYGRLCLASDYMDHPARHRRGPELAQRLRELAPGSPQALQVEQHAAPGAQLGAMGPGHLQALRTQLLDARLVLTAIGDPATAAARAEFHARARPDDSRLAVLAETLAVLARPGRAPLRWTVRAPLGLALLRVVLCVAILIAVSALRLPAWTTAAVLVPPLAVALFRTAPLRRARRRAALRPSAPAADPGAVPPFPALPPVPAYTRREKVTGAVLLTVVVAVAVASGIWRHQQYAAYPRYTVAAPEQFRGFTRQDNSPAVEALESSLSRDLAGQKEQTFTYVYGPGPDVPAIAIWGAAGDFHEATADVLTELQSGIEAGGVTVKSAWTAAPGPLGGSMRCVSYEIAGRALFNCGWLDKGSLGSVTFADHGEGHEAAAGLARSAREAVLHRGAHPDGEV
ncbi:hypothetical protein [Streptomyces sp. NPDC048111]|uniref:hypothetical protein n=1 Tax=Streptomyces sp. NPDC048111 TaxID=3365500 RepID=UPI003717D762